MQHQHKKPIAKHRREKRPRCRLLSISILFLWFFISGSIPVSAQKLTPEIWACYQSRAARYACFIKRQQGALERAKENEAKRRSIRQAQEAARLELQPPRNARREKERQEIMQQVQASRARNISHAGEKYSLTYGFVLEPR